MTSVVKQPVPKLPVPKLPVAKLLWLSIPFLLLILYPVGAEALSGWVVDAEGSPLPGALVENTAAGQRALTGADGSFSLPKTAPPVTLRFSLDGYGEGEIQVTAETRIPITIRLAIHTVEGEQIAVSARARDRVHVPVSLASTTIRADSSSGSASALADLAIQSPAVSENGQGGLFQVVSVRGVSRQRLRTLVGGVPIISDRRAGASASFVDPELLGALEIVRGPVSSAYGSGALGGLIQASLRAFDGISFVTGYESQGDSRFAAAGWGKAEAGWNSGFAFRQANPGRDGQGERLNNGFTQASAFVSRAWEGVDLLLLGSSATDIGKPNTDFPERETTYPDEGHLLFRLGWDAPKGWRVQMYSHSNSLETLTEEESGASAEVRTDSLDLGLSARRQLGRFRIGLDYFGRQSVDARERQRDEDGEQRFLQTLLGATEDELGVFASTSWEWGPAQLDGGGRWTWHRQTNGGSANEDSTEVKDNAPSLFVGLVLPFSDGFELLANVGTGFRFPSLGERFFSGTTGRGQAVANAALEPEKATTIDLGGRWFGARSAVSVFAFHTRIESFIERVETEPDVLTFVNLVSGTLRGFEVEALLRVSHRLRWSFGGHWTEGRDASGNGLEDVPPHRIQATLEHRKGRWEVRSSLQHRFSKRDIGGGEKEIASANLFGASMTRQLPRGLSLSLLGDNLLDTVYHPSADRRASLAPGRSLGLRLSWRP